MMVAGDADEARWPPTFRASVLSRRGLAWWMVQLASHRTFFSSSCRIASWSALVLASVPITGHLFRLARSRGPQHHNSEARYMCAECAVKLLGPGSSHR